MKKKEAKIILTGSNARLLSSEFSSMLSGRGININLYPYSYGEVLRANKRNNFELFLKKGGFPEISKMIEDEKIKLVLENYYKNILYQDIIPRFSIKNSLEIENLSYYLISNVSKEISYNTLKNISKLDDKTIKTYISYLEEANLIYTVYNYDPSLKKQIGNKKKAYSVDIGFINYLGFKTSPDTGRIFENVVYLELKKKQKEVFFYKDSVFECDFLIKNGHKIETCIQACTDLSEEKTKEREISGVVKAAKRFNLSSAQIITINNKDNLDVDGIKISILPFEEWQKTFI